jgi:Holliday junction resolvase
MKNKGARTERELLHKFWKENFGCVRIAGSGSTTELSTDLIAGTKGRVLAIECKSGRTSVKRYIEKKQIENLKEFSKTFGAEPWIGMRFDNEDWLFLKPEHLENGNSENFGINLKLARKKGICFDELIGKYKQKKLK